MHDRKGQIAEAFVFWIFYIGLTVAVLFFVVGAPTTVFSQKTQTSGLENAIFAERIYDKTAWQSPLTKRMYPGFLTTMAAWDKQRIASAFSTLGTPRRLAMELTLGHDTAYVDEAHYKQWKPLSPVAYENFIETRPVLMQDTRTIVPLTIDQVYAPKPPRGFS